MEWNDCERCKNFDKCYSLAHGNDNFPSTLPDYFNTIRERDLCVNNGKRLFERRKD